MRCCSLWWLNFKTTSFPVDVLHRLWIHKSTSVASLSIYICCLCAAEWIDSPFLTFYPEGKQLDALSTWVKTRLSGLTRLCSLDAKLTQRQTDARSTRISLHVDEQRSRAIVLERASQFQRLRYLTSRWQVIQCRHILANVLSLTFWIISKWDSIKTRTDRHSNR